jgi:hypothetical protein
VLRRRVDLFVRRRQLLIRWSYVVWAGALGISGGRRQRVGYHFRVERHAHTRDGGAFGALVPIIGDLKAAVADAELENSDEAAAQARSGALTSNTPPELKGFRIQEQRRGTSCDGVTASAAATVEQRTE